MKLDVKFFSPNDFDNRSGIQLIFFASMEHAITCKDASDIANRLILERSKVVYGQSCGDLINWYNNHSVADNHTARLICIEPVEKESAEKILREYVNWADGFLMKTGEDPFSWVERAKKLLERK